MKEYTFSAVAVTYGPGDGSPATAVADSEIALVFPDDVTTLSYEITGTPDSFDGNSEFFGTPEDFRIDGASVAPDSFDTYVIRVSFANGAQSDVLLIDQENGPEHILQLGGDPLPAINSADDFNALNDSITGVQNLDASPLVLTQIAGLVSVTDVPDTSTPGETVQGSDDGEVLSGSDDDDTIDGGGGDDRLEGGDGNDSLSGGDGDDGLLGGAGDDMLEGGDGDDVLAASDGDDTGAGDAGNDRLGGGPGNDLLEGGIENDTIGGGFGDDTINGEAGDDVIAGGADNDVISGGTGDDVIGASYGNDAVRGGAGNDDLGGGTGQDTIDAGAGDDSVGGGEGNDTIDGGIGNDFLAGGGRDDVVNGGAGDDTINGGDGDDALTGGAGADVFVWNSGDAGSVDTITDFEDGIDTIRLVGVENAAGTGLQGKLDALGITDTTVDGTAVAVITYQDQEIHVVGRQAAELGLDDFSFL